MAGEQRDDEDILEIIDQRRPAASPVKYIALAIVALAFIFAGYRLLFYFTPREMVGAATGPFEKSAELTSRFLQHAGNFLTSSRTSTSSELAIGQVTSTDKLGPLIAAKQDLNVTFTNVDEALFGRSTTEVRAMGKAFYYVPLLGPQAAWQIEVVEKKHVRVCVVHAPALRVLTPVNVDTRSLELRTATGIFRTNRDEMNEAALADVTPRLNREALLHVVTVRDAARKTVAAFTKAWLESDQKAAAGRMTAIQVLFPGETTADIPLTLSGLNERP